MISRAFSAILAAILAFAFHPRHAGAQEWTRFRGPNGSGVASAPKFPAQFSEADFNWKIELPGPGHSSPVIWGDRVFVTATPAGTAKRTILCIDAKSGRTLWTREYETA